MPKSINWRIIIASVWSERKERKDSSMTEWSKEAARKFNEQQEIKRHNAAKVVQDKQSLDALSVYTWDLLSAMLSSKCAEFNAEQGNAVLVFDRNPGNTLKIDRKDNGESLVIGFDSPLHTIKLKGESGLTYQQDISMKLNWNSTEVALSNKSGQNFLPEDLANDALAALLHIN